MVAEGDQVCHNRLEVGTEEENLEVGGTLVGVSERSLPGCRVEVVVYVAPKESCNRAE
jgi:hypothetical protein